MFFFPENSSRQRRFSILITDKNMYTHVLKMICIFDWFDISWKKTTKKYVSDNWMFNSRRFSIKQSALVDFLLLSYYFIDIFSIHKIHYTEWLLVRRIPFRGLSYSPFGMKKCEIILSEISFKAFFVQMSNFKIDTSPTL